MAAAINLQRDAGLLMTNLQILAQFLTSLNRMSSEMLNIGVDHVVFPLEEVERLSMIPRAQRAGQILGSDGPVAPSIGTGCYRAAAGVDLPFLHEMQVLFWQKRAINSVIIFVTFHGNTVPAGNILSLMSALYLWATLGCGVFGCHRNLV